MTCKFDFHIHTSLSACANKVMLLPDIVKRCRLAGLEKIGISDHLNRESDAAVNAALLKEIQALPEGSPKVYLGAEVGYNGKIGAHPLTVERKQELGYQYAIGSHHNTYIKEFDATKLIEQQHRHHLLTCQDPAMDVLGHPYRLLYHELLDKGWPWFCSMNLVPKSFARELGQASRDTGTAIEINTTSNLVMKFNPPQYFEHYVEYLAVVAEEGAIFSLGTDAHELEEIETIALAWQVVDRLKIPPERIWSPEC